MGGGRRLGFEEAWPRFEVFWVTVDEPVRLALDRVNDRLHRTGSPVADPTPVHCRQVPVFR